MTEEIRTDQRDMPGSPEHAVVRPPGDSFARAISSQAVRIDPGLARFEHAEYCQALRAAGLSVEVLPPDERFPDSCFTQDPAVVIAGQAVLGRMGAPGRQGEEAALAEVLERQFPLARIMPPGTLEGGDVMCVPGRLLVGQSGRTNGAGIEQLGRILAPLDLLVEAVPVHGCLHLLTAATYLGHNLLLVTAAFADHPAFRGLSTLVVPEAEAYAANVLAIGENVILPAGHPQTAEMLRTHGFNGLPVPMSQFHAADGGVTCLSLIW